MECVICYFCIINKNIGLSKILMRWWHKRKSQRIIKVMSDKSSGTMRIIIFCSSSSSLLSLPEAWNKHCTSISVLSLSSYMEGSGHRHSFIRSCCLYWQDISLICAHSWLSMSLHSVRFTPMTSSLITTDIISLTQSIWVFRLNEIKLV